MADEHWPLEAVQEGLLTKNEASKVEQVVHDLLGPDQKIVAVEKKVVVKEEEVIMVNKILFEYTFFWENISSFNFDRYC